MFKRTLLALGLSVALIGCGTDNPLDRGDDLPGGSNLEVPSGPLSFSSDVKPILQVCATCHSGGAGGWVYAGQAEAHGAVLAVIDTITPEDSELLIKATGGGGHGGGSFFNVGSDKYQTVATWIAEGAENN
ncbi:MAG: hypothetical protein P8H65_07265 [Rhodothermales bacterium]|jgi:hypothetical protein|nr:hypothetical protein [Rhodothermales bacterium]MDG2015708.1 hypothetical protein [Rhodothermales bacterium]